MSDRLLQEQREMVRDRSRGQRADAAAVVERRAQDFNAKLAQRRAERDDTDEY